MQTVFSAPTKKDIINADKRKNPHGSNSFITKYFPIMKMMHMAAFLLLVVGGLNWLLVGLFGWDIGAFIGGMSAPLSRIIYILVGLSAVYLLFTHKKDCKACSKDSAEMQA
jgi:uncharacterized protein